MSEEERERLNTLTLTRKFRWDAHARPNQLEPEGDEWVTWLILAGRGWGKTRTGVEYVKQKVERNEWSRVALVASTAADARDILVEGESGILAVSSPWFRPKYEPSKRRLTWPNGAIATTYTAEKPDELRGPQHDGAMCDEPAKWRYAVEAWDNLMMGLRLGKQPRCVATTTPKPTKLIKRLVAEAAEGTTYLTSGSTYENLDNLSPLFKSIIKRYEGTRLGLQELYAKLLTEAEGALWTWQRIEDARLTHEEYLDRKVAEHLKRIVVAIDPALTSGEDSNETGIIVAGVEPGVPGQEHGYVLEDLSGKYTPTEWATKAVDAYTRWGADRIVAEVNAGGEMVEQTVRTVAQHKNMYVAFKAVHASKGKHTRAEPVSSIYEQGRVHHVGGFADLEEQMTTWEPGDDSPDRLDALVWALTELMVKGAVTPVKFPIKVYR